jgi:hypothetical protein
MPDIIVKNTYEGVTRVYLCHSRTLFAASKYFFNAFSNGLWLETIFRSTDLKDDSPDVFAYWLKWEHTRVRDHQEIRALFGDDPVEVLCFFVAAGVHADKYVLEDFGGMVANACSNYAKNHCSPNQVKEAKDYFFQCGGRRRMGIYKALQSAHIWHQDPRMWWKKLFRNLRNLR